MSHTIELSVSDHAALTALLNHALPDYIDLQLTKCMTEIKDLVDPTIDVIVDIATNYQDIISSAKLVCEIIIED